MPTRRPKAAARRHPVASAATAASKFIGIGFDIIPICFDSGGDADDGDKLQQLREKEADRPRLLG
jgi:hypothetical protein